jgi:hypothetical protein
VVGVAGLALSEPKSLFTYDHTKGNSRKSSIPKNFDIFLMERGAKVIAPTLSGILDENDDVEE